MWRIVGINSRHVPTTRRPIPIPFLLSLRSGRLLRNSVFCKSLNMRYAIAFFVFYTTSLLPTNAAVDFLLAIGGHGKVFRDPRTPLATFRIWIEVLTGHGWTNASLTNTTEVRVDENGNYELEAIVGDARRRASIEAIRLYLEGLEVSVVYYLIAWECQKLMLFTVRHRSCSCP